MTGFSFNTRARSTGPASSGASAHRHGAGPGTGIHTADLELVQRLMERRSDAIDFFAERMRCIPRALYLKNGRIGSPLCAEDLADLAQETFATVWRRIDTYEGRASLETWAIRFALFHLLNALRRQDRAAVPLGDAVDAVRDERLTEPGMFDGQRLRKALAKLGTANARVIELREFDDLSFPEIAERLAEPVGTVKNRYYRGLERLRTVLHSEDERESR